MNQTIKNPFILVDGSSYLYRAFYALPALTNSKGQATGAIYGVINMINKLLKDYQPEYMAVVFDAKGKTFRDELFKQYKAQRPPMPNDLQGQIQPLQEIVKALGLPLLIIEGVEADDVIATLAIQAEKHGLHTLISTGDKDMTQIVNDKITLINTMSNTILDPEGVTTKFGIPPALMVDYLALVGDKVDNIPGIPNVGPKTAVKWLQEYGSLEKIVKNADKITGKVGENLRNNIETLHLSKLLATVKGDVDLDITFKDLVRKSIEIEKLIALYSELEFRILLSEKLKENSPQTVQQHTKHYETICNEKDFDQWLKKLTAAEIFAIDTETTSLNNMDAEIVGISFAINANEAAYIPMAHNYPDAPQQLSRELVLDKLKPLLENPQHKKLGQNIKYDQAIFANYGIDLQGIKFDTMLESYVLNSSASRHNLDTLAIKYLGINTITYEEICGKGVKQKLFSEINIETAATYAAEDADVTLKLHQHLWPKIQNEQGLKYIFENIEMPLLKVLFKIERHGVLIDADKLARQSHEISKRLRELEKETYTIAGGEFNMSSPKQLQEILFTKLQLPVLEKTPTGQASTSESVLQDLALNYPLPSLILEYRSLTKLKSTYTDALPRQINSKTGRVHTSYNQAIAATGRLSSTEPNLQNIPIRTEEGRRIRQAFIAPKNYCIVAADYSQIELRIMAHLSGDKGLTKAFAEGLDIHRATAAEVFNVALDEVTSLQRRNAKAINFGLIYGMSAYGLSRQLGIDTSTAQAYMDMYFTRYPNVKIYMEETRALAHKQGYVETLYGRRLYLPDINAGNLQRKRAAERAAINAPMQGTAADIIKLAMIALDNYLLKSKINAYMIMQVHDELVFEVHNDAVEELIANVKVLMTTNEKLTIPLVVGVGIGENWNDAH